MDHDLAPGAEGALRRALEAGFHVVFASNAPFEKVRDWLGCFGFQVADAARVGPAEAPLRAYGRAGKQELGDRPERMELGGRSIRVDRPRYRALLERERPDLVVGDVVSLDLSLPIALRRRGEAGAPRAVALALHRHTPPWVRALVGGEVDAAVTCPSELPDLLLRAREARPVGGQASSPGSAQGCGASASQPSASDSPIE